MNQYRITKYDPKHRNSDGSYQKNEWTSFGDIGREFENGILTNEEYLLTESAYIDTASAFMKDCTVFAKGVENQNEKVSAPKEGEKIEIDRFEEVCRSVLRGDDS